MPFYKKTPKRSPIGLKGPAIQFILSLFIGSALFLFTEEINAKVNPTDALFHSDHLVEISIRLDPKDWKALRTQYNSLFARPDKNGIKPDIYTYFQGDITIDGVEVGSVGIRKKGFLGSVISTRPSLKIKFNEYVKGQRYSGLTRLTLNNNNQDASRLHQYLVYKVFKEARVPAPRCNLARVTVNGEYLGIYSNVESIRKEFLKRHFSSASGNLYEGQGADFRSGAPFERKNNKKTPDRSHLETAIRILEADDSTLLKELENVLDVDAFMRFWATEVLTGHWDGFSLNLNNFYLYRDPGSQKFHFIPWGADSAFGDKNPFISYKPPATVFAESILCNRLYQHPEGRRRYREIFNDIVNKAWNEKQLLGEIDRLQDLLSDHISIGKTKHQAGLQKIRNYIQNKRREVEKELEGPAPDWPRPPRGVNGAGTPRPNGILEGTFKTTWNSSSKLNPFSGETTMKVIIGGKEILFSKKGADAGMSLDPVRSDYPSIRLVGVRSDNGGMLVANFAVDPFRWSSDTTLPVDLFHVFGTLLEAPPGGGLEDYQLKGILMGTMTLNEVNRTAGDEVSGKVQVALISFRP